MYDLPLGGSPVQAHPPVRVRLELVQPVKLPSLRGVKEVTAAEDRMHDQLAAAGQNVNAALSQFLHCTPLLRSAAKCRAKVATSRCITCVHGCRSSLHAHWSACKAQAPV